MTDIEEIQDPAALNAVAGGAVVPCLGSLDVCAPGWRDLIRASPIKAPIKPIDPPGICPPDLPRDAMIK